VGESSAPGYALVVFACEGVEARVPTGSTLLDAARSAGVALDAPCGGMGACRGCRVTASGELSEPSKDELHHLSEEELARGVRLACRTQVRGDARVETPGVVFEDGTRLAAPAVGTGPFGVAVDIGTTTIVASLVDMGTGDEVAQVSRLNPQQPFGADVMSRIAASAGGGEAGLTAVLRAEIGAMLGELAPLAATGAIEEIAVAGNTVMLHFLAGADVGGLAAAPYEPEFIEARDVSAESLGLEAAGEATARLMPSISGFVGSDIVAGLVAVRVTEREAPTLLVDVGTNGEIVLSGPEGLVACSTAAGPAFEAAGIECGMRAGPGAIERVEVEGGQLRWKTVAGAAAMGICGSGLVDLVAALVREGSIDATGRMHTDADGGLSTELTEVEGVVRLELAPGVYLTQKDVRALQLAKGALTAGIDSLLAETAIAGDELREVLVAGAFGSHLDPEALVVLGIIPPSWAERVVFVGNAAKEGAARYLTDAADRAYAERIAGSTRTLDLATLPGFQERFMAATAFPESAG
jgi:uncharacterized 2Fe-2S/4Fe-4S cluster protein (DUF4445 family)